MQKKFEVASVSTRGQITIPQDIREAEHIKEGDKMIITYAEGYVIMKKMTEHMVEDFFRTMKQIGKHVSFEDIKSSRKESEKASAKKAEKW